MNILLVNLTRFGDLLQSQAAITALADRAGQSAGPGGVGLVCLANFAFAAGFLRGLTHTFPLPKDAFLAGLAEGPEHAGSAVPTGAGEPSGPTRSGATGATGATGAPWLKPLAALWSWREEIWRAFKPDLVCNLTPTVPARLLSRYLAGEAPLTGFGLDESGFANDGAWAAFLRGSTRSRFASPFNIIDLFRAVAGSGSGRSGDGALRPRPREDVAAAQARLDGKLAETRPEPTGRHGFVGLQLGASEERRRWPLEYFVCLGQGLWRECGFVPVLLGGGGERELAARYAALNLRDGGNPPHLSLIGETSLEELAAVLECCSLLVSNDTGTLHLAAGLGRPALGIFLATAQVWDTGPGLTGCLGLEPDLPCHPCAFGRDCPHGLRCRQAISPEETLARAVAYLRRGAWDLPENGLDAAPENGGSPVRPARAWLTGVDAGGLILPRPLSGHSGEPRSLWLLEQRFFLSQFLDRNPAEEFLLQGAPELESPAAGLPLEQRALLAGELDSLAARLDLLLARGKALSLKPRPQFREGFLQSVRDLARSFESGKFFPALGLLWHAEMQEQGGDLSAALRCAGQYASLINGLRQRFAAE